jgi:hypothetical protein
LFTLGNNRLKQCPHDAVVAEFPGRIVNCGWFIYRAYHVVVLCEQLTIRGMISLDAVLDK